MKLKPYPKYKDSGIPWIGEIPEGWEVDKVKHNVYSLEKTGLKAADGNIEGDFPFFTSSQIQNKFIDKMTFNDECLIMGTGGVASVHYYKGKFSASNDCLVLKKQKAINLKFLYYQILNNLQVIDDLGFWGMGLKHLQKDFLYDMSVYFPLLPDQIAIANFLDKKTAMINTLIEKDKKLIALLKEKRTALINHDVTKGLDPNAKLKNSGIDWIGEIPEGWEVNKIKFVSKKVITGKTPPTENYAYYDNGNINWFTPSDLGNNLILKGSSKKISSLAVLENKVNKYSPNTVLLVGIGATLGKVGIITKSGTSNQQINAIEFNERKLYPKYGLYYLYGYKDALISLSNASTIGIFNQTQTANFIIIVPPLPEQIAIANYLDKATSKIDKTIKLIEKKIKLLEEYKKSLIHYVVTGKVDVRSLPVRDRTQTGVELK